MIGPDPLAGARRHRSRSLSAQFGGRTIEDVPHNLSLTPEGPTAPMVRRIECEEHSMGSELTVERLRQLVHYSPQTGRFYWRVRRGNAAAGFEAGSGDKDGYRRIQIDGERRYAHRLAWLYVHGEHPVGQIDHKNNKPADNRIKNLRDGPPQKNMWHRTSRSKSGIKGVSLRGSKWRARITVNGEEINLGSFAT